MQLGIARFFAQVIGAFWKVRGTSKPFHVPETFEQRRRIGGVAVATTKRSSDDEFSGDFHQKRRRRARKIPAEKFDDIKSPAGNCSESNSIQYRNNELH